jgi:hypothetical protein
MLDAVRGCELMAQSYKDLEIHRLSDELAVEVHNVSLGRKINNFIKGRFWTHNLIKIQHPASSIQHPASSIPVYT